MTPSPRTPDEHAQKARELAWDAGETRGRHGWRWAYLRALLALVHAVLALSADSLEEQVRKGRIGLNEYRDRVGDAQPEAPAKHDPYDYPGIPPWAGPKGTRR